MNKGVKKMISKIRYQALAKMVLAVAVVNTDSYGKLFDWTVYVDAVPGINHDTECAIVAKNGCKQSQKLAGLLFPDLDIEKYRR